MSSVASPVESSVSSLIQPVDSNLVIQTFPQPAQITCWNTHIDANDLKKKKKKSCLK